MEFIDFKRRHLGDLIEAINTFSSQYYIDIIDAPITFSIFHGWVAIVKYNNLEADE